MNKILEPITFHGQVGTESKFIFDNEDIEINQLSDRYLEHLKGLCELIVRDTSKILAKRAQYNRHI